MYRGARRRSLALIPSPPSLSSPSPGTTPPHSRAVQPLRLRHSRLVLMLMIHEPLPEIELGTSRNQAISASSTPEFRRPHVLRPSQPSPGPQLLPGLQLRGMLQVISCYPTSDLVQAVHRFFAPRIGAEGCRLVRSWGKIEGNVIQGQTRTRVMPEWDAFRRSIRLETNWDLALQKFPTLSFACTTSSVENNDIGRMAWGRGTSQVATYRAGRTQCEGGGGEEGSIRMGKDEGNTSDANLYYLKVSSARASTWACIRDVTGTFT
ncbi:hypothetical protein BJV74DRAFT_795406 [Russula compacta]|nr:hypothetical protein BJV74DRAFT_795406 [Russula compacta]